MHYSKALMHLCKLIRRSYSTSMSRFLSFHARSLNGIYIYFVLKVKYYILEDTMERISIFSCVIPRVILFYLVCTRTHFFISYYLHSPCTNSISSIFSIWAWFWLLVAMYIYSASSNLIKSWLHSFNSNAPTGIAER